jgi:hypothetical protein
MTVMTAKRARKSPKVETIWAYQRRRMVARRRTAAIESGSGAVGAGMGMVSVGPELGLESSWDRIWSRMGYFQVKGQLQLQTRSPRGRDDGPTRQRF